MKNYATALPQDRENMPMQDTMAAPVKALQTIVSENATVSSVISFNENTTTIEVAAIGTGAAIRWVATTDTQASIITAAGTSNYDNIVPVNTVRKFVVPRENQGVASIVGLNVREGLYRRVAMRSLGVGSILSSQY